MNERKYAVSLMNKELNNFEKGRKQGAIEELELILKHFTELPYYSSAELHIKKYYRKRLKELKKE